jgi:hypothetical protein
VFVTSPAGLDAPSEVTNTNTNKLNFKNFKPAGEVTNTNTNKLNFRDFPTFGSGRRLPALFVTKSSWIYFPGPAGANEGPAGRLTEIRHGCPAAKMEVTNTNTNKLNLRPAGEVTNSNTNKLNLRIPGPPAGRVVKILPKGLKS